MKIPVTTLVVSSKNSPEYTKKFIENYLKRLEGQKDKLKIFQELAPAGFRVIEVYGTSDKDMELDIESEEDIILFRETTQILLKNKGLEVAAILFPTYEHLSYINSDIHFAQSDDDEEGAFNCAPFNRLVEMYTKLIAAAIKKREEKYGK